MRKFKASVLVVTLIVLGIILVTALSVSLTSIKQKTASMGESKTGVAFQNAQSGIELAMDAILEKTKITGDPILYTADDLSGFSCTSPDPPGYAKLTPISGGGFTVELEKSESTDPTDCTINVMDIATIKSVGTDAGQKRAIEAVVASTNGPDWQTSTWEQIEIGDNHKTWAYSSGTPWYPSNCVAWFSNSSNPIVGTTPIYPMSCSNNSNATDSKQGWKANGTNLQFDFDSTSNTRMKHWDGSSSAYDFSCTSPNCYIKVMLWK